MENDITDVENRTSKYQKRVLASVTAVWRLAACLKSNKRLFIDRTEYSGPPEKPEETILSHGKKKIADLTAAMPGF